MTDASAFTELAARWDAITIDQLRAVGGRKWAHYPNAVGAFIAESDFGAAPEITAVLERWVGESRFGYLVPQQALALQEATAKWHGDAYGWQVDAEHVGRLSDVVSGLEVTLQHFTRRSDSKVILPTPAYMPFLFLPEQSWQRDTVQVPLEADGSLDPDALDRAFGAGGEVLVLVNPQNPTGHVYTRDELVAISEVVERHGGRVFADEIHAPLVYAPGRHVPYASVNEAAASHTVTATSASKAWNLAGLKTAQVIFSNDDDLRTWQQVRYWPEDAVSPLGIVANTVAYNESRGWLSDLIAYLDRNRSAVDELVATHLPRARYRRPEGTYLAWIDLGDYGLPRPLGDFILEQAGVAITDGAATGPSAADFIRVNFATPLPILTEIFERIGDAVNAASR